MLVPDPIVGVVASAPLGAAGGGSVFVPIPSGSGLVGTVFYAQWIVPDPGSFVFCAAGHFSNALQVQIQ